MISSFPTPTPSRTQSQDVFDAAVEAFLTHLPTFVTEANAVATAMNLNSTTDTSTSSVAIGTGAKTFTVSSGKSFQPGMWLVIADAAAPTTNAMFAQVSSYSGTTLVVNSYAVIGSGTKTAWVLSQSAPAALEGLYAQPAQIQSGALVAITATLTGTEYAATPSPAITAYAANQAFDVTFVSACPAAPTIKYNGIATPPNLVRQNVDGTYSNLASGAFPAGWRSTVRAISASQVLVDRLPPRKNTLPVTRDVSLASGSVPYTGAGFKARKVRVRIVIAGTGAVSDGVYEGFGAPQRCIYGGNPSAGSFSFEPLIGVIFVSAGNYAYVSLDSIDADGVTLSYAKAGSPTGTAQVFIDLEE